MVNVKMMCSMDIKREIWVVVEKKGKGCLRFGEEDSWGMS